ncbi:MAG: NUDIX domain-containing protein [Candidatus Izemoplasmatales bacterium]|jgi:8-oxo-dGTP pyrophosphatase MutT (NUDIX family)|nr:NUDIX domain-containing protein [Candidatus Izemoplasmatales bacterium]
MSKISYKNGLIEAVVFCFYKDGKILLEDRGKGFDVEALFPNGKIEIKDKFNNEYVLNALHREVSEEFNKQISIKKEKYLGQIEVAEINVLFYLFLIIEWEGDFPSVIKEKGKLDSRVSFFTIDEAKALFKHDNLFIMIDLIQKNI